MKRSSQPFFWLLFGAGGMLSALIGAMLVFVTGVAAPLGLGVPADLLSYPNALALARGIPGKLFLFVVVTLFLWHAAHRIYHSLHDLGIPPGALAQAACYGVALAGTLAAAVALLAVGF
ncbi:MAG TPA: fumarate reductase subunit FrdD [Usitatibacter sp.]